MSYAEWPLGNPTAHSWDHESEKSEWCLGIIMTSQTSWAGEVKIWNRSFLRHPPSLKLPLACLRRIKGEAREMGEAAGVGGKPQSELPSAKRGCWDEMTKRTRAPLSEVMWRGTAQIPTPAPCLQGVWAMVGLQLAAPSASASAAKSHLPPRAAMLFPRQFATSNREAGMQRHSHFRRLQSSLLDWPRPHGNSASPSVPPSVLPLFFTGVDP